MFCVQRYPGSSGIVDPQFSLLDPHSPISPNLFPKRAYLRGFQGDLCTDFSTLGLYESSAP